VSTRTFLTQHRDIEIRLDELLAALDSAADPVAPFHAAYRAVLGHYAEEDGYFHEVVQYLAAPVYKMLGQHAEVCEIAEQAEESLRIGYIADASTLIRRFHAIAQHNIIEEERDVFPLLPS
jgi:hypothetical protein